MTRRILLCAVRVLRVGRQIKPRGRTVAVRALYAIVGVKVFFLASIRWTSRSARLDLPLVRVISPAAENLVVASSPRVCYTT